MKDKISIIKLLASMFLIFFLKKFLFIYLKLFYSPIDSKKYSVIIPENFYSPWIKDISFNKVFKKIQWNTRIDKYRLFSIWELMEQTKNLNGDIIEIGIWRGGSGCLIAKKAQLLKLNSRIFLCDTFTGLVKSSNKDPYFKNNRLSDSGIKIVENLVKKLNLKNIKIIKGIFPDKTGYKIKNKKFRFCHIDVDTYYSTKDCLNWIWERLVKGGVIVFDDYGYSITEGVTKIVNEHKNMKDRFFIYNLTGQAIMIKK